MSSVIIKNDFTTIEQDLFSWEEFDFISDGDIQFYDCTLKRDIGKYKAGAKVEAIAIYFSSSLIEIFNNLDKENNVYLDSTRYLVSLSIGAEVISEETFESLRNVSSDCNPDVSDIEELDDCDIEELDDCDIEELDDCDIEELDDCDIEELDDCDIEELDDCDISEEKEINENYLFLYEDSFVIKGDNTQFFNCILKVNIGEFKKGTKFSNITITEDLSQILLFIDEKSVTYNLGFFFTLSY